MKIIIDAMGGDNAPLEIVKGAIDAHNKLGVDIILVGSGEEILRSFQSLGLGNLPDGVSVVNASQVITMEDDPAKACREKKDSSMTVALNMLRDGLGEAVVSAGSTGALLSGATLIVKRIRGIRRAALSPTVPTAVGGQAILLDVGANVDCTAEYLVQFAFMGYAYAKYALKLNDPRVGLLNNGAEKSKGGKLQKEVHAFLSDAAGDGKINFVGNVEGSDVLSGKVDVVVTDGFTGNVMLKSMEGMSSFLMSELKGIFNGSTKNKLAGLAVRNDFKALKAKLSVGGSIMLGISKPVIKAHGSSKAAEICAAIEQAAAVASSDTMEEITRRLEDMKVPETEMN
ncbi:MAG: phosphate acyltransferase PlsX [Clostridiales bacterium]|nr:phosphate acyltransferase PlsX [Clostridiales bacterium]